MKQTKKRLSSSYVILRCAYLISFLCFLLFPLDYINANTKQGSIEIQYSVENHRKGISGAEFLLIKVMDFENGSYTMNRNQFTIEITKEEILEDPEKCIQTLIKHINHPATRKQTTSDTGSILFKNIEDGIWLLIQNGKSGAAKQYELASPSLIQVPQWQDGYYTSHVLVYPKTKKLSEQEEIVEQEGKIHENNQVLEEARVKDNNQKNISVKTGDWQNLLGDIGILIGGIVLLFLLCHCKRRIKYE